MRKHTRPHSFRECKCRDHVEVGSPLGQHAKTACFFTAAKRRRAELRHKGPKTPDFVWALSHPYLKRARSLASLVTEPRDSPFQWSQGEWATGTVTTPDTEEIQGQEDQAEHPGPPHLCVEHRCRNIPRTGTRSSGNSRAFPPSWCSAGRRALSRTRSSKSVSCASAAPRLLCIRLQRWSRDGEAKRSVVKTQLREGTLKDNSCGGPKWEAWESRSFSQIAQ